MKSKRTSLRSGKVLTNCRMRSSSSFRQGRCRIPRSEYWNTKSTWAALFRLYPMIMTALASREMTQAGSILSILQPQERRLRGNSSSNTPRPNTEDSDPTYWKRWNWNSKKSAWIKNKLLYILSWSNPCLMDPRTARWRLQATFIVHQNS